MRRLIALGLLSAGLAASAAAEPREMTLDDVLTLAEKSSPALSAARLREAQAELSVGIARSGYYPTLEWDEMDSSRFPESSENLGIGGLIGSPYRSGRVSAGVAKATLWDFGRTSSGVEAAKRGVLFRKEDTKVTRYAVEWAALAAYYDCSRYRSQSATWKNLREQSELVATEIIHFVRTGQRSVVDRMLADAQTQVAAIEEADFNARWGDSLRRLSVWTGAPEGEIACPPLPTGDVAFPAPSTATAVSPLVSRALAESEIAKERVRQARAGYWPKIVAAATAGRLDTAGVKDHDAYAFAGGVVLPLFDGLKTPDQVRQAKDLASEKNRELEAAEQGVADLNARLDETIDSSLARLAHLEQELVFAQEAFRIAKQRYFSFEGTVQDLREALRNLAQTQSQIIDSRTELLKASGAKALLNGIK